MKPSIVKWILMPVLFMLTTGFSGQALAAEDSPPAHPVGGDAKQGNPLRLEELIQYAKVKSPEILAARAEWLAAKKRPWIDASLPDPVAEYAPGNQENQLSVMQDIPFIGKLFVRGKMASKNAKAAYFRYQATERDVVNRLTNAYYDLYFIDASTEVINEIKELLKRFESVASASYSNRTGSQRDVAKAQAQMSLNP